MSKIPAAAHKALRDLNDAIFLNNRCILEIKSENDNEDMTGLVIDSLSAIPPMPKLLTMEDEGSIYGKVVRVNQRRKDATIITANDQSVILKDVDDFIAVILGRNILKDVYLSGTVLWDMNSWVIISMKPNVCKPVNDNSEEFFNEMARGFDIEKWKSDIDPETVEKKYNFKKSEAL
jgi:hypothetical protein